MGGRRASKLFFLAILLILLGILSVVLVMAQRWGFRGDGALADAGDERPDSGEVRQGQPEEVTNSIGMKLVLIPAGKFLMGSPNNEEGRFDNEGPQHAVEITKPFYLGQYEVTRGQFRRFVEDVNYRTDAEKNSKGGGGYDAEKKVFLFPKAKYSWRDPGFAQTDEHPVVNVSWNDAKAFCDWLNRKEGKEYRLPTEAEWEYSCRANTRTRFHSGYEDSSLRRVANIADRSLKAKWGYSNLNKDLQRMMSDWFKAVTWDDGYPFTAPVGQLQPNAFGLYDMHGNVWEWCADWYSHKDYYRDSPLRDPQGPSAGGPFFSFRVSRGGSFSVTPSVCRAAERLGSEPASASFYTGFRVVCVR